MMDSLGKMDSKGIPASARVAVVAKSCCLYSNQHLRLMQKLKVTKQEALLVNT